MLHILGCESWKRLTACLNFGIFNGPKIFLFRTLHSLFKTFKFGRINPLEVVGQAAQQYLLFILLRHEMYFLLNASVACSAVYTARRHPAAMFEIKVSWRRCDTEFDIQKCSSVGMQKDVGHTQPNWKNCGFNNSAHHGLRLPSTLQYVSGLPVNYELIFTACQYALSNNFEIEQQFWMHHRKQNKFFFSASNVRNYDRQATACTILDQPRPSLSGYTHASLWPHRSVILATTRWLRYISLLRRATWRWSRRCWRRAHTRMPET